ncbi:flavin reductase [Aeromicrobium alkaliterrae]|uniref:Flavin reductase n=1 Tax=Aeromicrobium alkaliterrae TaxID=302168 RepID=A0ABN2KF63_9ACTN
MSQNQLQFGEASKEDRSQWWRTVLGEYPTGVCIVSALGADGLPQGLVVGTFSAVSLDPPLVSYMPMRSSRSYGAVRDAEYFRVSVLGAGHEELCRAFATAPPESRFAGGAWETDRHGIPFLTDSVIWFECKRHRTVEAGDHDIVLGEVLDLGFGRSGEGMPLLFLKGGYGSFTVPHLDFDAAGLGAQMKVAEEVRAPVQRLAEELDAVITLGAIAKSSVVVLSAANLRTRDPLVGSTFPFAAPLGSVFAAWGTPEREAAWRDAGRKNGFANDDLVSAILTHARERGYSVSLGATRTKTLGRTLSTARWDRDQTAALWNDIVEDAKLAEQDDWGAHVTSIQVPVIGSSGHAVLSLAAVGLKPGMDRGRVEAVATALQAIAHTISMKL